MPKSGSSSDSDKEDDTKSWRKGQKNPKQKKSAPSFSDNVGLAQSSSGSVSVGLAQPSSGTCHLTNPGGLASMFSSDIQTAKHQQRAVRFGLTTFKEISGNRPVKKLTPVEMSAFTSAVAATATTFAIPTATLKSTSATETQVQGRPKDRRLEEKSACVGGSNKKIRIFKCDDISPGARTVPNQMRTKGMLLSDEQVSQSESASEGGGTGLTHTQTATTSAAATAAVHVPVKVEASAESINPYSRQLKPEPNYDTCNAAFLRLSMGTNIKKDDLKHKGIKLNKPNLKEYVKSPYDWRIIVAGSTANPNILYQRGFYLSMGPGRVYYWTNLCWEMIGNLSFEIFMPKDTIVYAQLVEEFCTSLVGTSKQMVLHVMDAMIIGGVDVTKKHYIERHAACIQMAKAAQEFRVQTIKGAKTTTVRAATVIRLEHFSVVLENLFLHDSAKDDKGQLKHSFPLQVTGYYNEPIIYPSAIVFMKISKEPWSIAFSHNTNRKYFFNKTTGESCFDLPSSAAISDFAHTMANILVWDFNGATASILKMLYPKGSSASANVGSSGGYWKRKEEEKEEDKLDCASLKKHIEERL